MKIYSVARMRWGESISIRAIDAPKLFEARRCELVTELRAYFAKVDAKRDPDAEGNEEEASMRRCAASQLSSS